MAIKTIMLEREQVKEKSALSRWLDRKNSYFTVFAQEGEIVTHREAFSCANKVLSIFALCSLTSDLLTLSNFLITACLVGWTALAWRKEISSK